MTGTGVTRLLAVALLLGAAVTAQIQNNGTAPIAPQPAGMPPPGIFNVTAVTYAALPPNDHYSARLTSTAGGKSFGYLLVGFSQNAIIYDAASQTITFSNQFIPNSSGLQVKSTDGVNQAGIYINGATSCFVQTPGGLFLNPG